MPKIKYFTIFLLMWGIYFITNFLNAGRGTYSFNIFLDGLIPFVPLFVFFYFIYFPFVLLPFLFAKGKNFINLVKANIFIILISNLIYVLIPTKIPRPEFIANDIPTFVLNFVYNIDNNVNLFPSLHVSMTFLALLAISKINKKFFLIALVLFALTTLSTLFIKQHYVLDVLSGLMLGYAAYKIYFKKLK